MRGADESDSLDDWFCRGDLVCYRRVAVLVNGRYVMSAAAILGGVGSVLSGLSGFGGSSGGWPSSDKRREQYGREDTRLQRMMADARAAGVSPYAVLGTTPAAGSMPFVSSRS